MSCSRERERDTTEKERDTTYKKESQREGMDEGESYTPYIKRERETSERESSS